MVAKNAPIPLKLAAELQNVSPWPAGMPSVAIGPGLANWPGCFFNVNKSGPGD